MQMAQCDKELQRCFLARLAVTAQGPLWPWLFDFNFPSTRAWHGHRFFPGDPQDSQKVRRGFRQRVSCSFDPRVV